MTDYITTMWQLAQNGEKQGVLFFVVVYVTLVMSYSFIRQYLASQWPCVKGQLIDSGLKKFGSENSLADQDYRVNSLYQYAVNGKTYQGKRVSPWVIVASHNARGLLRQQLKGIQYNPDGTVNVYYNPKKPQKSFLIKPGFYGMLFTAGVIPITLYINIYLVNDQFCDRCQLGKN